MKLHMNIITGIQIALILLILGFVGMLSWDRWFPYQIITFWDVEVLNADRAVPGATLWIKLKYDKYMTASAVSTKVLVCGKRRIFINQQGGSNPVGENQENIIPVTIPDLSQDEWDIMKKEGGGEAMCYIHADYRYTLASGREVIKYWDTKEFPIK